MKHTAINTPEERSVWHPLALAILLAVLSAIAVTVAITTTSGCGQELIPIYPEPGAPCGNGYYFECPDHGCCGRGEECTPDHKCRFVGEGPLWGASRDGGARTRPELTPAEAQKAGPR